MAFSLLFRNRQAAGEQLAQVVLQYLPRHPIVYALPRGGLPVAEPIAQALDCPLSIVVAKKITTAENSELALGAVTADGCVLWSSPPFSNLADDQTDWQSQSLATAQAKASWQLTHILAQCPWLETSTTGSLQGQIALLVDDGIATGMTMAVAVNSLRQREPDQVWICAPVAPLTLVDRLQQWCDRLILLDKPDPFYSVSRFYQEFPQVEMAEAIACLIRCAPEAEGKD